MDTPATKTSRVLSTSKTPSTPPSYTSNNHKEDLGLEYVRDFRANFHRLFPKRRSPFLTSPNEYGTDKFICCSLRPTQLPFLDLYDYKKCAGFLAHYLDYEKLEDPTSPPSTIPSSTQVLEWGVGDCYDYSMLLCSYLIGAGYDAYVVHGYAPRYVCERDQADTTSPLLEKDEEEVERLVALAKESSKFKRAGSNKNITNSNSEAKGAAAVSNGKDNSLDLDADEYKAEEKKSESNTYIPRETDAPTSKFVPPQPKSNTTTSSSSSSSTTTSEIKINWSSPSTSLPPKTPSIDPLEGTRVHSWVLIRAGKRDIQKMIFIEPSTARIYSPSSSPYLGIEGIFNNHNYWCNMQYDKVEAVSGYSYDFSDVDLWEYVYIDDKNGSGYNYGNNDDDNDNDGNGERDMMEMLNDTVNANANVKDESISRRNSNYDGTINEYKDEKEEEESRNYTLDIPDSWVSKLSIKRAAYVLKYPPDGQRSVIYDKSKLELYAENTHDQSMVQRLTIYANEERSVISEIREVFVNRRDKLVTRVRFPLERKVQETFAPGRVLSLKSLTEWCGKRREIVFYVNARLDGLLSREEDIGKKIIEKFEGRGDNLVYRSVGVKESNDSSNKSTFILPSGGQGGDLVVLKMTEKFERNKAKSAKVDVAKRTYYVDSHKVRTQYHYADACVTRYTSLHDKERSADSVQDDSGESLHEVIHAEKECLTAVRHSQHETVELLTLRRHEEEDIIIDQPIFETAGQKRGEEKMEEQKEEREDEKDKRQLDYLTPYLQNIGEPKSLTRDDAQKVRDNCLKSLKDRLLERANIIQNRLNDENTSLAKQQAAFQRNQRDNDPDAEEEFERFCSEAMFRIQILEQRLQQHEESALRKYKEMDQKLLADSRMAVLRYHL